MTLFSVLNQQRNTEFSFRSCACVCVCVKVKEMMKIIENRFYQWMINFAPCLLMDVMIEWNGREMYEMNMEEKNEWKRQILKTNTIIHRGDWQWKCSISLSHNNDKEAIWRESICFTNHNQNSIVVIVMFDSRALASAFLPESPISLFMEWMRIDNHVHGIKYHKHIPQVQMNEKWIDLQSFWKCLDSWLTNVVFHRIINNW